VKSESRRRTVRAKINALQATGRTCGECDACCTVMRVDELEKDQWTACEHLRTASGEGADSGEGGGGCGGCGVYAERPESCRRFKCLWLSGLILSSDEDRPDRSGLVLVPSESSGKAVGAFEVWPGAAEGVVGKALIDRLRAAGLNVIVGKPSGFTRLAPLTVERRPVVTVERISPSGPGAGATGGQLRSGPGKSGDSASRLAKRGSVSSGGFGRSQLVAGSLRRRAGGTG